MIRLIIGVLASGTLSLAQVNTASIVGDVMDQTGASIAAVTVTITNVANSLRRSAVTTSAGNYELSLLPAGEYRLEASGPGFKSVVRSGIILDTGQRAKMDITLELGAVTERVEVTDSVPLVNTQTVTGGVAIKNQQVLEMPLNGRNFSQLIQLEPGVVMTGGGIFFNGLTRDGVNITVDGTDASNPDRPSTQNFGGRSQMNILSIEFIEEFRTSAGVFSAELGRAAAGGVNVITKSGTNEFHGSIFEFFRNEKLDARNFFAVRKDPLKVNQFGAAVGGPILRDKLFFFGGWEGSRVRRGLQVSGDVPTQALRDRMLASIPAYKEILDLTPLPNVPGVGTADIGFHRRSDLFRNREDGLTLRLDYRLGNKDSFFARYSFLDSDARQPNLQPRNGTVFPAQDQSGTASWSRIFGNSMLNELRVGWNKQDLPRAEEAWFGNHQRIGNFGGVLPTVKQEVLQANGGSVTVLDNFSLTRSRHSLKFGFENRRFHYGRTNYENPAYQYDTVEDIVRGTWNNVFITVGNALQRFQESQWGVYVQDDWRAAPRLTLNLGLRYEYYTPVIERNGNMYNVVGDPFGPFAPRGLRAWNPDRNNFGPRFGMAWDISGNQKNVIRLGAGVFYSPNTYREVTILGNDPALPYEVRVFRSEAPDLRYPVNILDPATFAKLPVTSNRLTFDRSQRTTYSEQWSAHYQREVVRNLAWQIGYIGNRGLKLLTVRFLNDFDPALNFRRPVPAFGRISYQEHSGNSAFHSLQTSLTKRFSHGFTFNTHYTWGRGVTYGGVDSTTAFGNSMVQDPACFRCSRSRSIADIGHNFVLDGAWEVPAHRWAGAPSGALRFLLDGWQVNGIIRMFTGRPINILSGRDNRGNGDSGPQRPHYIGGDVLVAGYRSSNNHQFLNAGAFAQPVRGTFGNLGANIVSGPGTQLVDLSVFKTIPLRDRLRLQFRVEFFDALNRPNFDPPAAARLRVNNATFGQITSAGLPREIQFALKLLF